jgi:hypothetical protein
MGIENPSRRVWRQIDSSSNNQSIIFLTDYCLFFLGFLLITIFFIFYNFEEECSMIPFKFILRSSGLRRGALNFNTKYYKYYNLYS